jgi:hypothetical protein
MFEYLHVRMYIYLCILVKVYRHICKCVCVCGSKYLYVGNVLLCCRFPYILTVNLQVCRATLKINYYYC